MKENVTQLAHKPYFRLAYKVYWAMWRAQEDNVVHTAKGLVG